jgi:hypothetical protein
MGDNATVEFTKENAMKCLCGQCPVQEESACVADKSAAMDAAMKAGDASMPMPSAADFARLYCANGKASCDDLDFTQTCICMECPVYGDNGLRGWKYCERGSAAEVG